MKSIKIFKSPDGFDPEIRRLQLIGLTLLLPSLETLTQVHNVIPDEDTYVVLTKNVISALKKEGKDSAVDYWSSKGALFMEFNKDACQVIS